MHRYTHPKLLRILLSYRDFCEYNSSLDSSFQALVTDILQEILNSRSDTVCFTVDIRKQCKVLGPKFEVEIFILQILMEKRCRVCISCLSIMSTQIVSAFQTGESLQNRRTSQHVLDGSLLHKRHSYTTRFALRYIWKVCYDGSVAHAACYTALA